jgi:hypothetical protein
MVELISGNAGINNAGLRTEIRMKVGKGGYLKGKEVEGKTTDFDGE